ncbi:hypothetical protein BGZ65_004995 [Modicella reniformis]|uniref:Uncharacterized protein n=1 Tax=Modicella reniformis TaxID=1440133 RepID=A0A9P6LYK4_9FUNG|nr:hypothetical protein BGZ65_004995 [Modicella reniformis]
MDMVKYNQQLKYLKRQGQQHQQSVGDRHQLRNTRHYPPTVHAPHPPFRVTFIISKKTISKLSTDRNLVKKKLAAAVEMTFRDHAKQGYEYLIFAKQACITTTQAKLMELLKKDLANPALYGGRAPGLNNDKTSYSNRNSNNTSNTNINSISDTKNDQHFNSYRGTSALRKEDIVTVRWKNNRPSLRRQWWRYALPNPLGRIQQSDAYLDRLCYKRSRETSSD